MLDVLHLHHQQHAMQLNTSSAAEKRGIWIRDFGFAHLSRKQIFSRTYRVYVHASFCLLKKREGCIRCPAGCNFWCMLNRNKPPVSRFGLCACAAQVHAWVQQTIGYIPIMSCDYASATWLGHSVRTLRTRKLVHATRPALARPFLIGAS